MLTLFVVVWGWSVFLSAALIWYLLLPCSYDVFVTWDNLGSKLIGLCQWIVLAFVLAIAAVMLGPLFLLILLSSLEGKQRWFTRNGKWT